MLAVGPTDLNLDVSVYMVLCGVGVDGMVGLMGRGVGSGASYRRGVRLLIGAAQKWLLKNRRRRISWSRGGISAKRSKTQ